MAVGAILGATNGAAPQTQQPFPPSGEMPFGAKEHFMRSIKTTNKTTTTATPASIYDEVINDGNIWRLSCAIALNCLKGNFARSGDEVTRGFYVDCWRSICIANRAKAESIKDTLNGLDFVQEIALALTPYRGKKMSDKGADHKGNEVTLRIAAYRACNAYIRRQARKFVELTLDDENGDITVDCTFDEFTRRVDDGDENAIFLRKICEALGYIGGKYTCKEQVALLYCKYSNTEISNAALAKQVGKTPAAVRAVVSKIQKRLLNNFGDGAETVAFEKRKDGKIEWNGYELF